MLTCTETFCTVHGSEKLKWCTSAYISPTESFINQRMLHTTQNIWDASLAVRKLLWLGKYQLWHNQIHETEQRIMWSIYLLHHTGQTKLVPLHYRVIRYITIYLPCCLKKAAKYLHMYKQNFVSVFPNSFLSLQSRSSLLVKFCSIFVCIFWIKICLPTQSLQQ